jgi:hypothetical protein
MSPVYLHPAAPCDHAPVLTPAQLRDFDELMHWVLTDPSKLPDGLDFWCEDLRTEGSDRFTELWVADWLSKGKPSRLQQETWTVENDVEWGHPDMPEIAAADSKRLARIALLRPGNTEDNVARAMELYATTKLLEATKPSMQPSTDDIRTARLAGAYARQMLDGLLPEQLTQTIIQSRECLNTALRALGQDPTKL